MFRTNEIFPQLAMVVSAAAFVASAILPIRAEAHPIVGTDTNGNPPISASIYNRGIPYSEADARCLKEYPFHLLPPKRGVGPGGIKPCHPNNVGGLLEN